MSDDKPEYQRLIKPALELLSRSERFFYFDEISETLAEILKIPMSQLDKKLPSGRQTVFENQLHWALSYLEQDGLIDSDGANAFRARTNRGAKAGYFSEAPVSNPNILPPEHFPVASLSIDVLGKVPERASPQEIIARQYSIVNQQLTDELMDKIHSQPPQFFENLIIDLLLAMNYGDRRRDLHEHLGRSGDGGVDGAIPQDQLGLDTIYIQAKRYRRGLAVPVSSVRDFAGALQAHKATKGVFVTISHFTKSAHEFISQVSGKIVLINGQKLASLLVRNNVGVRISETWEIKHIDEDYFSPDLQKQ